MLFSSLFRRAAATNSTRLHDRTRICLHHPCKKESDASLILSFTTKMPIKILFLIYIYTQDLPEACAQFCSRFIFHFEVISVKWLLRLLKVTHINWSAVGLDSLGDAQFDSFG